MPLLPARSASCRWRAEDGLQWPVRHPMWASAGARGISLWLTLHSLLQHWCHVDVPLNADFTRCLKLLAAQARGEEDYAARDARLMSRASDQRHDARR
jgi:hypothetical protein